MSTHPLDLATATPAQVAKLRELCAKYGTPWTVAVRHAWISADGATVGVTLRSVDYAEPVSVCKPATYPPGYLDGP